MADFVLAACLLASVPTRRQHIFNGGWKDGVMDYWTGEIPQPSGPALKRHLQLI